ncbi:hypothetical protein FH972_021553 [Carpinus fangiana]|uniref:amidase n=1 Tax=Carpinus fangiana TaxID=176857 RepID=A0A5N6KPN6_9ROSI|nr:hypothetical protein FH972_021553 [Carpinus fangiana]
MSTDSWESIAAEAQKHRDASIDRLQPPLPGLPATADLPLDVTSIPAAVLTPQEVAITEASPEHVLQKLAGQEWSAVDVASAFLRRAGLAQQLVNCITELTPERALARAKECDDYLKTHGKPMGPLHGLPISVKEMVGMKGLDLNAGFCGWWGTVAEEDAWLLDSLWDAGCVFYARTTQPQTLMHLETSSNLYGVTVNPYNRNLTSGGSSGGEGALLGIKGSCLGIGTDIGGSIRSPAANNGVYGLRPTANRLPLGGLSASMEGAEHIMPVIGPMSTSLAGIDIFMHAALAKKPWLRSPSLVPLPWTPPATLASTPGKPIKVGVLWDDGIVKPHLPILRALQETVAKLQTAGNSQFEFVDWTPYKHDEAWEIIASLYFADGGAEESAAIASSGEPWRPLSRWIIPDNPHVKNLSIAELWALTNRRDAYRAQYAQVWNDTASGVDATTGDLLGAVDVILCPVGPGAAPPLDCARYWGYTSQWNLLDYPALVFPVGKVDQQRDAKDGSYQPRNEQDLYNHELYDPKVYENAPISLQLVGRRFEDEKVVGVCRAMEAVLKTAL